MHLTTFLILHSDVELTEGIQQNSLNLIFQNFLPTFCLHFEDNFMEPIFKTVKLSKNILEAFLMMFRFDDSHVFRYQQNNLQKVQ